MEKADAHAQLEQIKNALAGFKEGASLEEILEAVGLQIELRTLQRRLALLQKAGLVKTSGKTRATRYHLVHPTDQTQQNTNTLIPLSPKAQETRATIMQPIAHRRPVSYNIDFLASYLPQTNSYLTEAEKNKLAKLGKTTIQNQAAGTYAKEILQRLLIDLSWNSSRLEGNTYSLLDTQRLISQGELAGNRSAAEAQMILNHKDAIEFIVRSADETGFNRYTLTNLHALLSNNLLADPAASGRMRTFGVGITNSVYIPLSIPQQIEELFDLMLAKANEIENPFEQAFFIMVHLPYLQPFDDVNKRVSRLAANIPLNKNNLAPLAFVDVPNDLYIQGMLGVYELNRIDLLKDVFMWAYERSALRYAALRQSLGEPDPFRLQYRDQIRTLITDILSKALPQAEAGQAIESKASDLPHNDQKKFIEAVETELLSLHPGNFARYWVSPAQFAKWQEVWKK